MNVLPDPFRPTSNNRLHIFWLEDEYILLEEIAIAYQTTIIRKTILSEFIVTMPSFEQAIYL
jgi:hypothetical protein